MTGVPPHNLTRRGQQHATAAGVEPWRKFYQAMRSSCEDDWKAGGVAEPTYCAWLGHSPTVSRKHYTQPRDTEFAAITKVDAA